MRAIRAVSCWLSILAAPFLSAQSVPRFTFTDPAGPHAVGLMVMEQYDYARTYRSALDSLGKPYTGERARPVQTLVWYPAEKSGKTPMTVGDYAVLRGTETESAAPALSRRLEPPVARGDAPDLG